MSRKKHCYELLLLEAVQTVKVAVDAICVHISLGSVQIIHSFTHSHTIKS